MTGLLFPLLLSACIDVAPPGAWRDQLSPEGPCYRVDLADGLSETDTTELHDLFGCLNQGSLEPLSGMVDSLDQPTRAGLPAGVEVAHVYNHLPNLGFDLGSVLETTLRLLDEPESTLLALPRLAVELIYGICYDQITTPSSDPAALDQGILPPLVPLAQSLTTILLDDQTNEILPLLAETLEAETLRNLVYTLHAASRLEVGAPTAFVEQAPLLISGALTAVRNPGNDHWAGASGDSLRDALNAVLAIDNGQGITAFEELLLPLSAMLQADEVRSALEGVLYDAVIEGRLALLPSQFGILATEDISGGPLSAGEDSALAALVRLLALGNQEVECSIFGLYDIGITDNFSVWLLGILADQDPETIDSTLRVAGFSLDWVDFLGVVGSLADNCGLPGDQFAQDLPALNRLVDPEVGDLLVLMLDFLSALRPSESEDHLDDLVELLASAQDHALVPPVEELVKDLATGPLVAECVELVPALVDPSSERIWCPDSCKDEIWTGYPTDAFTLGGTPVDLDALFDLADVATATDTQGRTPISRLRSIVIEVAGSDAAWEALYRAGSLLGATTSELSGAIGLLNDYLGLDPDLSTLGTAASILENPDFIEPLLRVMETEALGAALTWTTPEAEGPLPFIAGLVTDGTLVKVLRTVDFIFSYLEEAKE